MVSYSNGCDGCLGTAANCESCVWLENSKKEAEIKRVQYYTDLIFAGHPLTEAIQNRLRPDDYFKIKILKGYLYGAV